MIAGITEAHICQALTAAQLRALYFSTSVYSGGKLYINGVAP